MRTPSHQAHEYAIHHSQIFGGAGADGITARSLHDLDAAWLAPLQLARDRSLADRFSGTRISIALDTAPGVLDSCNGLVLASSLMDIADAGLARLASLLYRTRILLLLVSPRRPSCALVLVYTCCTSFAQRTQSVGRLSLRLDRPPYRYAALFHASAVSWHATEDRANDASTESTVSILVACNLDTSLRTVGMDSKHAVGPPSASCFQSGLFGLQLWRRTDHLRPLVRHLCG